MSVRMLSLSLLLTGQSCNAFCTSSRGHNVVRSDLILSESIATSEGTDCLDPRAVALKDELLALATSTRRGFSASRSDRDAAKKIINDLSIYSPTDEPAAAYYINGGSERTGSEKSDRGISGTISGKWTLAYTDAPDITSLEGGPFSTAKLGKIGQECTPPSIKNVIEWKRPDWAAALPLSGGDSSRVLQKVCCEGTASPNDPNFVDLKIVGLDLLGTSKGGDADTGGSSIFGRNIMDGPAGFFKESPIELRGPLKAPFGKFEILYLDFDMRIIQTYQGFLNVNIREEKEWF